MHAAAQQMREIKIRCPQSLENFRSDGNTGDEIKMHSANGS